LTVIPICKLCERAPETPVKIALTEPAAADVVAEKVIVNGAPGPDCRSDGEIVIPDGKPARENVTAELKPLSASTVTEIDAFPPPVMVTLLVERVNAKSGDAGGGVPLPPPQAANIIAMQNKRRIEIPWTQAMEVTPQDFTRFIRVTEMAALGKSIRQVGIADDAIQQCANTTWR
jgi:hypothetical protein